MTPDGLVADLETLRSRIDLVEAVRDQPREKPALATALDCSRSTVTRAVRELEEAGLLRRGSDGYELTLYGDLLYRRYEAFLADAATIADARSLLAALPPDAPMDPAVVCDAAVARSRPPAPYEPLTGVRDRIDGAGRLRGVAYRVPDPTTLSLLVDRIDDGLAGELIVGSRLVAYLLEHNPAAIETMRAADRFELAVGDPTPYTLLALGDGPVGGADDPERVRDENAPGSGGDGTDGEDAATTDATAIDDEHAAATDATATDGEDAAAAGADDVVLIVYDEHGDLEGTITTDDPAAVRWASELLADARREADPVGEWLGDGSAGPADDA